MKIKKISVANVDASSLPKLFDQEKIGFEPIQYANWPDKYPYKPRVSFRMAYTSDSILLNFNVKEESVRAKYKDDNQSVWTDSCVEFFSIPAGDGIYYNIECNCIGTILIGAGDVRENRERAPQKITNLVQRWSSLGENSFNERLEETNWEVALIIPFTAFFKHHIESMDGKVIKANFYKCGDELQTPHFLSWNPIETNKPDFHRPDFFGELEFKVPQSDSF